LKNKKKISVVTPCFNEAQNISLLVRVIQDEFKKLPYSYEHIIVDNCSTDGTIQKLRQIALKDKRVKIILNTRNFGADNSSFYGLLQSSGDACIMLPSDFQIPFNLIVDFLKSWEDGSRIVLAVRKKNESYDFFSLFRKVYYRLLNNISNIKLVNDATGYGLYDKKIIDILKKIDDPIPYFRGLLCEIGYPIKKIFYVQKARLSGKSSQNFFTLIDAGLLGVVKHSKLPLRIFTIVGGISSILSFIVALFYFYFKLFYWDSFEFGMAPLIIGFFFFTGIQLLGLGLIGEYLQIALTHVRKFPLVIESERINFKND